jgi:phospholipid/cholesterol/gamma-HCH transport system substrate-binding protein
MATTMRPPADPRARRSSGVTRRRLAQEGRRAARPLVTITLGAVLLIAIAAWFVVNISQTFGRSTYDLRFAVGNAFGIFAGGDEVRFRGVPAGTIEAVERHGTQLVILARIRSQYGPVYRNAHAELRPITPLNDVYLDITDPGTPSAGRAVANRPLPQSQTTTSVTVPDVLDGLTADARQSAYRLLDNLGNGLADRGLKLRQAFVQLGPFLSEAGTLTRAVALHQSETEQLVHDAALLTTTLATRQAQLKRLVATGAATFGTLQQSSGDLGATLAQLAPTVQQLDSTLGSVRSVLGTVDGGLDSLIPVANALPTGLFQLRSLARVLDPAATRLTPAARATTPFVERVRDLLGPASQITAGLLPQTPVINRTATDLVKCRTGVIDFFQWNASLTKMGDTTGGPVPRGNLAFGIPSPNTQLLRDPIQACTPGTPERYMIQPGDEH